MRSFQDHTEDCVGVLCALSPKLTAILQRLGSQCCMVRPLHASNQRHCEASKGIHIVLGKRSRIDGWGLHEDPTANVEYSGDLNGAHVGKLGKTAQEERNSLGSVSVPVSGYDTVTWSHCDLHVDRIRFAATGGDYETAP